MSLKCHTGEVDYEKLLIFRKPSEIGYFSLDGERKFHDDDSQIKWIHTPASGWNGNLSPGLNWDLNEGYQQAIKKDFDTLEKGGPMLMWMLQHQKKIQRVFLSPKSNELKVDFVFSRGLLTRIGSTLYDKRNDWSFCASKFKSVIYMVAFETDKQLQERRNDTERRKLMISWGAKFEQYMTCATPDSEPNTSISVNEKEEYHIVLKGQLNGYTLLYNAEVDGKNPQFPLSYSNNNDDLKSTDCYIELKTNNLQSRGFNFRQKLQRWWLQSFIGGIPKIVCGHRDGKGIVKKLETFDVQDIPGLAKGAWNKELCLKFSYHILDFVKKCVREDNPEVKIDFVCARGLLTKICATPYDSRNDWAFCATKFKSVIYMRKLETDQNIYERENETECSKLMTFWGTKFEQYMTCDTPNSEPNTSIPVNEMEGYHIVLKGQINEYTLLYSAEVDGKDPQHPQSNTSRNADLKSNDCYIELKTAKTDFFRGRYHREKLLKWWLQSFLGGIPKIVCGYRDENGIVKKLETFFVKDIPEIEKESWNKEVCLKFAYYILDFVKTCVVEDNPEIVYMFQYELDSPYVKCKKMNSPREGRILPEWFTDEFNN